MNKRISQAPLYQQIEYCVKSSLWRTHPQEFAELLRQTKQLEQRLKLAEWVCIRYEHSSTRLDVLNEPFKAWQAHKEKKGRE